MNFEFSEEQVMLRDMARKFAEQEMLPTLREYESARKVNHALIKKMASLDLRGIHIPKEFGGIGLSYSQYMKTTSINRPLFNQALGSNREIFANFQIFCIKYAPNDSKIAA